MAPNELKDRVALITGASGAIGMALARQLASLGASLCLTARRADALAESLAEIKSIHSSVISQPADLLHDDSIHELSRCIREQFGRLDILIHCAGYLSLGSVEDASVEEFDRHFRVNVRAPYLVTQLMLPLLKISKGHIVFIDSSVVLHPRENVSQYAATKQALRMVADVLRHEVNRHGIRVTNVLPGRTASRMQESLCKSEGRAYSPEKLSQPKDVADAVVTTIVMPRTTEVTELSIRPMIKS
ncbi:MAG: SDR family NAD(P)-dependent oxidoreductase [Planctomycetes bacterium]|nr:SDR family NAD(P)-dependent oxidoreductase [Planctomycetota bacterium]